MARFRTSGTAHDGQKWILVPALVTFAQQIEAIRPKIHATDGTVAGAAHDKANANSDHTVWPRTGSGRVFAIDVGDSEGTIDAICEQLRASKDPRIMYVIRNKRMFSSYATSDGAAWTWRPLKPHQDPHLYHMHMSVQNWMSTGRLGEGATNALVNDTSPWKIKHPGGGTVPKPPKPNPPKPPSKEYEMKRGDKGRAVAEFQHALQGIWKIDVGTAKPFAGKSNYTNKAFTAGEDGDFGPKTEAGVKAFQTKCGLPTSGVVDGITHSHLFAKYGPS